MSFSCMHRHPPADPIALLSTLGKRNLELYKQLNRAAAASLKFVPTPDGEPLPKRGRGSGEGEGRVVVPRGDRDGGGYGKAPSDVSLGQI